VGEEDQEQVKGRGEMMQHPETRTNRNTTSAEAR
jgi:hypothetical protein